MRACLKNSRFTWITFVISATPKLPDMITCDGYFSALSNGIITPMTKSLTGQSCGTSKDENDISYLLAIKSPTSRSGHLGDCYELLSLTILLRIYIKEYLKTYFYKNLRDQLEC